MAGLRVDEKDLRRELTDFEERYPKLADDQLFVLWFLRAFVIEDDDQAANALVGGPRDKGVDAVLIDERAKVVFLVQGKYRQDLNGKTESRGDVLGFAQLACQLLGVEEDFAGLTKDLDPAVCQQLRGARERLKKRGYQLRLYYVTLGRCSEALRNEANRVVRRADGTASIEIYDGAQILLLFADYLDGVAPPVPSLDLEIEAGRGVHTSGALQRYDGKTQIESWIFSMSGATVARLYEHAGDRLFARNVRGFLGNTEINRGMENTLEREPEHFWYYNNGITIVCDKAERVSSGGQDILRVRNPQVINGQQTTRTLHQRSGEGYKASVLVRVIRIPRASKGDGNHFETLVSRIVAATNWQNAIRPSDLMSNDRRQIEIEREFRKLGYLYLRKRQTKYEARRVAGGQRHFMVKKEELAQAVAACELDPAIVRKGKEGLFEEQLYQLVFPTGDSYYYLSRYWLMRAVGSSASGYPERAYAKWLVLHFVWSHLEPLVRARESAERFRRASERWLPLMNSLDRAIYAVFQGAMQFYRRKRGTGATAIDVSTFFQRVKLHQQFERFWQSTGNNSRSRFRRAWLRFEKQCKKTDKGNRPR